MIADEQAEHVPLYRVVAAGVAEGIITGIYPEGGFAPSMNECARAYGVNPATAAHGLRLLVERGVLVPQRGVGMRVVGGAAAVLCSGRRESLARRRIEPLVREARELGLSGADLMKLVAVCAEELPQEGRAALES